MLNERIKNLRLSHNLTQKQLADVLSISMLSMQRFEYGTRRPSLDTIITLANYFDVSIDYLVGRTDNPDVNK